MLFSSLYQVGTTGHITAILFPHLYLKLIFSSYFSFRIANKLVEKVQQIDGRFFIHLGCLCSSLTHFERFETFDLIVNFNAFYSEWVTNSMSPCAYNKEKKRKDKWILG